MDRAGVFRSSLPCVGERAANVIEDIVSHDNIVDELVGGPDSHPVG